MKSILAVAVMLSLIGVLFAPLAAALEPWQVPKTIALGHQYPMKEIQYGLSGIPKPEGYGQQSVTATQAVTPAVTGSYSAKQTVCIEIDCTPVASTGIVTSATAVAPAIAGSYSASGDILYVFFIEEHGKNLPVDKSLEAAYSTQYRLGTRNELQMFLTAGLLQQWPAQSVATDPENGNVVIKTLSLGPEMMLSNTMEYLEGKKVPTWFVDSFVVFPDGSMKWFGWVQYYLYKPANAQPVPQFLGKSE